MTSTLTRVTLVALLLLLPAAHTRAQEPAKSAPAAAAVNLNSATVAELETLPGIGPRAAQRILEFRSKNGGFKKVEDLMKIQGIGERSFLKLKPLVTVGKVDGKVPQ
jgi:competence protein ComEA